MGRKLEKKETSGSSADVTAFLKKVRTIPLKNSGSDSGRLVFAMDATASRQATWDSACHIQREMFDEAATVGSLALQIAFFRGYKEFKVTPWTANSQALTGPMSRVQCLGGHTQINRVLGHVLRENEIKKVNALVYVGDCMEEDADNLCHLAGELGLHGVPIFIFHEGHDLIAENCFRQMCSLSHGAYCRFDASSAQMLKTLLKAVAVYAVGGHKALEQYEKKSGADAQRLLRQLK
jgi:hypothetical protein